jgi:membrane protein DedA with SNARE-associated domain
MTVEALYWYASIFAWLFFTGIGIPPCPEEAGILYAASVNALHPDVKWPLAWLATALGIIGADSVLYWVGRRWGRKLFEYRWVQKLMSTQRRQRIEAKFHKHGIKLLVVARFLPPLRTGVFMIAGASKYSFLKFVLADAIYGVIGVGMFFFFGTFLVDLIRRSEMLFIYIGAGLLTVYVLYRYYRFLRLRELATSPEPPASVLEPVSGVVPDGQPAKNPAAAGPALREAKVEFGEA